MLPALFSRDIEKINLNQSVLRSRIAKHGDHVRVTTPTLQRASHIELSRRIHSEGMLFRVADYS